MMGRKEKGDRKAESVKRRAESGEVGEAVSGVTFPS